MKDVNFEAITDMQSWCRTWPPNGSSRFRARQKLHRKHKGACKSSWSRIGSLKSFTLTLPWNLAKPVKTFPGIIARQHLTVQRQMLLLNQYCCNQVWMKYGWRIPWNVIPICEIFRISCLMGNHHKKGGSECHFHGPVIPFGSMVEYHPISAKDLSRLHQFGKKVLPGIFLGYVLCAGGSWKGDILVADIEELEKMDASEIHAGRLNAKEVLTPKNGETFTFPIADVRIKHIGGD